MILQRQATQRSTLKVIVFSMHTHTNNLHWFTTIVHEVPLSDHVIKLNMVIAND